MLHKRDLRQDFLSSLYPHGFDSDHQDPYRHTTGGRTSNEKSRRMWGEQIIGSHGDKYLLYLVHNDHFHANLKEKFKAPKEVLTVDYLERTFFETCLTIEERENAVTTLTKFGRLAGEPYSHYAHRIARATKLFRVQDNNDVVLTLLRQGLASSEMDTVNTRFQSQYVLDNPQATSVPDTPIAIADFCIALGKLTGPAGARENFSAPVMPTTNSHAAKAESKQMWCDKCNKNGNHVSKDHISCDYCNKLGHKKDACRARQNDERRRNEHSERSSHNSDDRQDRSHRGSSRFGPYQADNRQRRDNRDSHNSRERNYN
ncbi:hypothetical protein EMPS_07452 [Entomortierella parvispora]|uniref:Uncharacterized protein n=1 Tax=Entomortierella parvispora TaxID=205924 RepID=A0A9P3HE79_9FUNG|nr:hypothetical protein EMPS_07452 [Entomortierella parvispora]